MCESLNIYFDWNEMSVYENQRSENLKRNYDVLKSIASEPQEIEMPIKIEKSTENQEVTELDIKSYKAESISPECHSKTDVLWKKVLEMDWGDPVVEVVPNARRLFSFYLEKAQNSLEFLDKIDSNPDHDNHDIKPLETRDRDLNTERARNISQEIIHDIGASTSHDSYESSNNQRPETGESDLNTASEPQEIEMPIKIEKSTENQEVTELDIKSYKAESISPECHSKTDVLWKKVLEMDWGHPVVEVAPNARRLFSFYLEKAQNSLEFLDKIDSNPDHDNHDIKPLETRDRDLNTERARNISQEIIHDIGASTSHDSYESSNNQRPETGESDLNTDAFSSQDSKPEQRYPKRNIAKICYTEEEISSDDDFLFCEDCGKVFQEECPVHGRLIHLLNKKVPRGSDPNRAKLTCPSFLSVGRSGIKDAGLGIWTEIALKKGLVFGPFEGKIVKTQKEARLSGYAWELLNVTNSTGKADCLMSSTLFTLSEAYLDETLIVRRRGRILHHVDGRDTSVSSWLRFVNCAPCKQRQNLIAFQYKGEIYYKTYKHVPAFAELLVWYGNEFAENLGIIFGDDSDTDYSKTGECNEKNSLQPSDIKNVGCLKLHSLKQQARKTEKPLNKLKEQRYSSHFHCEYAKIQSNFKNQLSDVERTSQVANVTDTKENAISLQGEYSSLRVQAERKKGGQNASQLLRHSQRNVMHKKLKLHKCPHCENRAENSSNLRAHMQAVREGLQQQKCPQYEYRAAYSSDLRVHVQAVHEGLKQHKCLRCEYRATHFTHLRRHTQAVHEGLESHRCPHCEYRASRSSNLRRHMQIVHEGLNPYQCPHCEYRAAYSSDLRVHVRAVHKRPKQYKCLRCEFTAKDSTNLRRHIRGVHERLKPHRCPHCEYRTAHSNSLLRHVHAVHEGMKPHQCPHCEYRTTHSYNLWRHMQGVHD